MRVRSRVLTGALCFADNIDISIFHILYCVFVMKEVK